MEWYIWVPRYLAPRFVVVQVHQAPRGLLDLTGIHEATRELNAILNVGRAATPLPALLLVVVALLLPVAAALAQVALAAGRCDCMGHARCCNGIGERRFPTACREEEGAQLYHSLLSEGELKPGESSWWSVKIHCP